ncbi:hypothetical protein WICMUC_000712 [Wickerhamomyces mucosus]|uniref:NuA3 HAT complex component NTO1 n=1 Tax=Wickerhamomyces mucosus TaxID=1378264 RepID=A0A9P8TIE5_9ASCO|nr:hypothetical protein WICMUC_000712 [Wickerhamomyces mucosus]
MSIDRNVFKINYDPSKPREEHDYFDFYPDLNTTKQLPVLVIDHDNINELQKVHDTFGSGIKIKNNHSYVPNKPEFEQIHNDEVVSRHSKIPKSISKLGYRSSNASIINQRGITEKKYVNYIREDEYFNKYEENNQIFENISKNQMNFKSKYDMDQQDYYFMKYINEIRNEFPITHEIFEITMTILENEWFYIEKKIPPKIRNINGHSHKLDQLIQRTKLYGADDGMEYFTHDDEQKCAVCNSSEGSESNAIIYCDGCDIAVHQDCYGVMFIPEGQWLCRKCMLAKKQKVKCQFCPSTTGAFKQLSNGQWGHVMCGIWLPEIYFASAGHMEPIEGIEMIPKGRWKLNCFICKEKCGAPIQCANRNCFTAFHVTCARRAGLYMNMKEGIQGAVLDKSTLECFCHKHSPPGYNQENDLKSGIERAKLYFATLHNHHPTNFKVMKKREDKKKWKTKKGSPLAPNFFINILNKVYQKFNIMYHSELALEMVKYWNLKREMKSGAPLIRMNDNNYLYTGGDPEEIPVKLDFTKTLIKDLQKMESLSEDLISKHSLLYQSDMLVDEMIDIGYFPVNKIIRDILAKIFKIDSTRHLLGISLENNQSLTRMLQKAENRLYIGISEFLEEIDSFFVSAERLNQIAVNRAIMRIKKDILSEDYKHNLLVNSEKNLLRHFKVEGLKFDTKDETKSEDEDSSLSDVENEM